MSLCQNTRHLSGAITKYRATKFCPVQPVVGFDQGDVAKLQRCKACGLVPVASSQRNVDFNDVEEPAQVGQVLANGRWA